MAKTLCKERFKKLTSRLRELKRELDFCDSANRWGLLRAAIRSAKAALEGLSQKKGQP